MKSLEGGDAYKYMGVLEEDKIKHKHVKNETTWEYFRRVRIIMK